MEFRVKNEGATVANVYIMQRVVGGIDTVVSTYALQPDEEKVFDFTTPGTYLAGGHGPPNA